MPYSGISSCRNTTYIGSSHSIEKNKTMSIYSSFRDSIQQFVYKIINPGVRAAVKAGVTPNVVTTLGLIGNIAGAALLEIIDIVKDGFSPDGLTPLQLGAGFIISAATSFAALEFLIMLVKRKKLSVFSYYVTFAGIAVIVWQLIKLNRG